MTSNQPDNWRTTRWNIARAVIGIDLLMFIALGFVVYKLVTGHTDELSPDPFLWTAWIAATGPLVAAFAIALRVMLKPSRPGAWRLTAWSAGLFLGGVSIITAVSILRDGR
ncbi:hypothetical protein [Rugosimonospora africana]|uniref:Uncharacterized protein n=1 Tax=Rugosimonospora africana TaxID=556532 RepID=A0A8J3QP02_9ACTN|nr:hypothetical protein [Rugosimonospora africana]GIH14354.1 hypothetical protein Raf01_25260 [Rugosimonospora africana]